MSGLFDNPEGAAVFHGSVWVSNNGGNAPAATLVRLTVNNGQLDSATYGGTVNHPFACPGGLYASVFFRQARVSKDVAGDGGDGEHDLALCVVEIMPFVHQL